jgi:hypothetical protein
MVVLGPCVSELGEVLMVDVLNFKTFAVRFSSSMDATCIYYVNPVGPYFLLID